MLFRSRLLGATVDWDVKFPDQGSWCCEKGRNGAGEGGVGALLRFPALRDLESAFDFDLFSLHVGRRGEGEERESKKQQRGGGGRTYRLPSPPSSVALSIDDGACGKSLSLRAQSEGKVL